MWGEHRYSSTHCSWILSLAGGKHSASCPSYFALSIHWTGGLVGPKANLHFGEQKILLLLLGFEHDWSPANNPVSIPYLAGNWHCDMLNCNCYCRVCQFVWQCTYSDILTSDFLLFNYTPFCWYLISLLWNFCVQHVCNFPLPLYRKLVCVCVQCSDNPLECTAILFVHRGVDFIKTKSINTWLPI